MAAAVDFALGAMSGALGMLLLLLLLLLMLLLLLLLLPLPQQLLLQCLHSTLLFKPCGTHRLPL